ncbi:MAG: cytochrome C [Blastocatellia bacterium]|nr:MAG: cytochrome C [Blastocatellia bacterium]
MKKVGKIVKWIVVIGACLFVVAQLIRPARTNPSVDPAVTIEARTQMDPQVARILDRSCADCHSNKTRWPWYTNVAPVSWFIVNHVNEGRHDLNFSEWGNYNARRQDNKLHEMCDLAKGGVMPLGSYTPLHKGSTLSDEDKKALCDWTNRERAALTSR